MKATFQVGSHTVSVEGNADEVSYILRNVEKPIPAKKTTSNDVAPINHRHKIGPRNKCAVCGKGFLGQNQTCSRKCLSALLSRQRIAMWQKHGFRERVVPIIIAARRKRVLHN